MLGLRKKTLAYKAAIPYVIMTLVNITVFVTMVFENQMDLISENAVLNSEKRGINLKFRTDNIMAGKTAFDNTVLRQILKEARFLGIQDLTVFEENGDIRVDIQNGHAIARKQATPDEIKWISKAITKATFGDRIFAHEINRKEKAIRLYVPVTYGVDNIIVLSPRLHMLDIDRQMTFLYRQCMLIGLLLILIHTGMGIFFAKIIIKPLSRLNTATAKIAQGELGSRVEIIRDDEIGQLAISFNEMTVALQRMHDEAKGANPLTGLPGNISIVKEIDRRILANDKFAVLYCDIDNFKAYNDKYGFTKGDQVILYTRDCIAGAGKKKGDGHVFVGHEGGDDFVVIAPVAVWEEVAKFLIQTFDHGAAQFYNEVDAKNGFIESVNRQGIPMRFPLVSISVAVVSNERRAFKSHSEMVSVAAEMKKYVKAKLGSCYAIDRRTDPPPTGYPVRPLPTGTPPPPGPYPPGVKPAPVYDPNAAKVATGQAAPKPNPSAPPAGPANPA